jgi:hypothetical protein
MYKTIYTEVEVEVDLDEWSDADLIEELGRRKTGVTGDDLLRVIYEKRRLGQDYETELDTYICDKLGKVI